MKIRYMLAAVLMAAGLTACKQKDTLTAEEKEKQALEKWFTSMSSADTFPDVKEYEYYARTLDLDSGYFLNADMWNVYYNDDINRNRDIDHKAIYLIALDTDKLLEVWAERNGTTADGICRELGLTADELRYNFGYTAAADNYSKNHKDGLVAYSLKEERIFGRDNGEDRKTVFSTHFLEVDLNKYKVTYRSENEELSIRQRDLLHSTTKATQNYTAYTDDEKCGINKIGDTLIKRVTALNIPNGFVTANDENKDVSVMFNASPYTYGCTDEDIVKLFEETAVEGMTDINGGE